LICQYTIDINLHHTSYEIYLDFCSNTILAAHIILCYITLGDELPLRRTNWLWYNIKWGKPMYLLS